MNKLITYEAPDVTVYEIHSEGALCGSILDSPNNGYEDDNDMGEI
ncbi:MAG: hypothetical protein ACI4TU_10220 [Candidatus Cryptobacteroides sp.]